MLTVTSQRAGDEHEQRRDHGRAERETNGPRTPIHYDYRRVPHRPHVPARNARNRHARLADLELDRVADRHHVHRRIERDDLPVDAHNSEREDRDFRTHCRREVRADSTATVVRGVERDSPPGGPAPARIVDHGLRRGDDDVARHARHFGVERDLVVRRERRDPRVPLACVQLERAARGAPRVPVPVAVLDLRAPGGVHRGFVSVGIDADCGDDAARDDEPGGNVRAGTQAGAGTRRVRGPRGGTEYRGRDHEGDRRDDEELLPVAQPVDGRARRRAAEDA